MQNHSPDRIKKPQKDEWWEENAEKNHWKSGGSNHVAQNDLLDGTLSRARDEFGTCYKYFAAME
jgi:hypothetical protein